jgi:hypothetical protein
MIEQAVKHLKRDWPLILPVSFCYALVFAFFELVVFVFVLLSSDSPLGQSFQRVNPFLGGLSHRVVAFALLACAWPLSLCLVLSSRLHESK